MEADRLKRDGEGSAKGGGGGSPLEQESTRSQVAATERSRDGGMRSETEVRRFYGSSHSACGGFDDSAVET